MDALANLLSKVLKIPVDRGIDYGTFAEVLYQDKNLGTVAITHTSGNLIVDTHPNSVANLRWSVVYFDNQSEINNLIAAHYNTNVDDLAITIGTFRQLYIRNAQNDLLGKVTASFVDTRWRIDQE